MVEIYRQSQDTLNLTVPTGVERIQAGLSYSYGDDQRYMQAYNMPKGSAAWPDPVPIP